MVDELKDLVEDFPGPANQTRCFTHILNLVVKSILCQFDLPKSKSGKVLDGGTDELDEGTEELLALAGDIEVEEEVLSRDGDGGVAVEEPDNDNIEGWIDERTLMDDDDLEDLDQSVKPVRVLLTKVSNYLIHNYLIN